MVAVVSMFLYRNVYVVIFVAYIPFYDDIDVKLSTVERANGRLLVCLALAWHMKLTTLEK